MMEILVTFFSGPWSSPWFAGGTLDQAALLLTAALGAAVCFRAGLFNLGGEGQIYCGAVAAAAVLLAAGKISNPLPAAFISCGAALSAVVTGALLGAVSGVLKKKAGADELITSFLLAAALTPAADFLVGRVMRGKTTSLLATDRFNPLLLLPRILPPSTLTISIFLSLFLCAIYAVFFIATTSGYRYRIAGADAAFARYGGIEA